MSLSITKAAPLLVGAGIALGVLAAPVAAATVDPCASAVSTSRCQGPSGVQNNAPDLRPSGPVQNGPYGPWGNLPPLG